MFIRYSSRRGRVQPLVWRPSEEIPCRHLSETYGSVLPSRRVTVTLYAMTAARPRIAALKPAIKPPGPELAS
jgi:hypothetical protein